MAQLPLIMLLSTKRNFVSMVSGTSYERLNILHRWTSRGLLVTATIHFCQSVHRLEQVRRHETRVEDRLVPAHWPGRHILTFIGFIAAVMVHIPETAPYARTYVYVAIGLYGASKLIQGLLFAVRNRRLARATITQTPTVASSSFLLRRHRGFTRTIHTKANANTTSAVDGQHLAFIDGPYGSTTTDYATFTTAVLIAGSTGITYTIPILLDLAERARRLTILRRLVFVFATRDRAMIDWAQPSLVSAVAALEQAGVAVVMHIHETRAQAVSGGSRYSDEKAAAVPEVRVQPVRSESQDSNVSGAESNGLTATNSPTLAGRQIVVQAGRPDVRAIVQGAMGTAGGEMGVVVCGRGVLLRMLGGRLWASSGMR
ncbi:hypothetical protein MRB53_041916 [Persea americana]|nr:hypothetical protein MRB53_041916 [Persea americana]